jgi:hypothetical protein
MENVSPEIQSAELSSGYISRSNGSNFFSLDGQVTIGCKDFSFTISGNKLLEIVKSCAESLTSSGCIYVPPCQTQSLPAL